VLSAALGAGGGLAGAVISSTMPRMPTGPTIVLVMSGIALVSFLLAPNRGLVWGRLREITQRRALALDTVLLDLYQLGAQHDDPKHPHSVAVLESMERVGGARASLKRLASHGWVRHETRDQWSLTDEGVAEARRLTEERG